MNPLVLVLVVVAVVAVGVAAWLFLQKRRTEQLSERFGPEYGRTMAEYGDRSRAEAELQARQERVERLDIRPLPAAERDRFANAWRAVQTRFVDDPPAAVDEADSLIGEVMGARGYPMSDFEQRADDISVDHPQVVDNYRAAHELAGRSARGDADTEDLRKAMVYYRTLFEELLETTPAEGAEVSR